MIELKIKKPNLITFKSLKELKRVSQKCLRLRLFFLYFFTTQTNLLLYNYSIIATLDYD